MTDAELIREILQSDDVSAREIVEAKVALDRLESQALLVPRLEEALHRIAAMASMEASIAREALVLLEKA